MAKDKYSLLAGRNHAALSPADVRRAINTFLGFDRNVNARYEPSARTAFGVRQEDSGDQYGEIVFGPDIYPGPSVIDPNSALSLDAAVAHELTHYHRWKDKTALPKDSMEHLDEALTSLQSVMRYERHLSEHDVRQLICDAIQRLQMYIRELDND